MRPIIKKHEHFRSPKLLALANGAPCMNCGAEDGTIVAAHSNAGSDGKGMGIKADDACIAFLCRACHCYYDGDTENNPASWSDFGPITRQIVFLQALSKTYLWLLKNGKLKVS